MSRVKSLWMTGGWMLLIESIQAQYVHSLGSYSLKYCIGFIVPKLGSLQFTSTLMTVVLAYITSPCNLSHTLFFFCPMLHNYWNNYFETVQKNLNQDWCLPYYCILYGVLKVCTLFSSKQLDIRAFTSLLARWQILFFWKSTKPLGISQWLVDTMFFWKKKR